jgi:hypothetical protein
MFKHTKQLTRNSKLEQTQAFLDFALAEVCSGIEMAQAAKITDNKKLAAGFIRHAFDEYNHARIFYEISRGIIKRENLVGLIRYISLNAYDKKYIDRNAFLFEKLSRGQFSIFVHISEDYAAKHFVRVIKKVDILNKEEIAQLHSILADEKRHIEFSSASAKKFRRTNPVKYRFYKIIERINLVKRNINDKSSFLYELITRLFLSVSFFWFRILARSIIQRFSEKKNHHTLSSAINGSGDMF